MFGEFRRGFIDYHKKIFSNWKTTTLVEQEKLLGQIIDSDMAEDFVLIDEVIELYDMVRDECVKRLAHVVGMEV